MRQYIITIINTKNGVGSIEVANSEDRVGTIIDGLTPDEKFFVAETNEDIMTLEEGRLWYERN